MALCLGAGKRWLLPSPRETIQALLEISVALHKSAYFLKSASSSKVQARVRFWTSGCHIFSSSLRGQTAFPPWKRHFEVSPLEDTATFPHGRCQRKTAFPHSARFSTDGSEQGSANFFSNGPESKYSQLYQPPRLCRDYSAWPQWREI